MLIILSGSETIHKKFFAKKIIGAMNRFHVDGYTVDFTNEQYKVYDAQGRLVYSPHHDDSPGYPPASSASTPTDTMTFARHNVSEDVPDSDPDLTEHVGDNTPVTGTENLPLPEQIEFEQQEDFIEHAVMAKIDALYKRVFLDGIRNNHFQNFFVDLESDYGNKADMSIPEWEEKPPNQFHHPHTYNDVLNNYRTREFENFVISGSFSRRFIDKIRGDIGHENVIVLNIVRNPSVACLLQIKPDAYYIAKPAMTVEIDTTKIRVGTINCANLARFTDILTLKFEDLLHTGHFIVNGVTVGIPNQYIPYNSLMTTWEREYANGQKITESELAKWNKFLSSEIQATAGTNKFPSNIFAVLGYTPMTIEHILQPTS